MALQCGDCHDSGRGNSASFEKLTVAEAVQCILGYHFARYRLAGQWLSGPSWLLVLGYRFWGAGFGGLPLPMDQLAGCLTSMPELGGRKAQ
jgi:hypothetical protein